MKRTSKLVPWKIAGLFGLAVAISLLATLESTAQVQRYLIRPGSQYMYLPSGFGPGIPGGEPSPYQLDFGISGSFRVEYDDAEKARLLDFDLDLSGNEIVQEDALPFSLVRGDVVADWLEERMLVRADDAPTGPWTEYADERFTGFRLRDFSNGDVTLRGGFDSRRADGSGINFDVTAVAIPEPSTFALAFLAVAAGSLACGLRR